MLSITEENYLKTIFKLSNNNIMVNTADLGRNLSVSAPTVNSMMKKLSEKGYIIYKKYRPVMITRQGEIEAKGIIRRHRLAEMFLVEKMGIEWENVHEIAEQIEHIKSPVLFDRMEELLGSPEFDPHGSPIPDKKGRITERKLLRLSNCTKEDTVRLSALDYTMKDFIDFLNNRNIYIGVVIKVISVEEFDGSMIISYKNHERETLSRTVCDNLLVKRTRDHLN